MDSLDYIDNYFKGQLNAEEIRQFELRIEQDPVFAQDVAFYVSASGILKEETEKSTRERFRELEQMQPGKMKQSPVRKMVYWMAAAAISIGFIFRMFFMQPSSFKMAEKFIASEMTIDTAITMGPTLDDSIQLAKNYFYSQKYPEALKIYDALMISYPEKDEVIVNAGIVALKAGNTEKAIGYFEAYEAKYLYANKGKFYYAVALMKRDQKGDLERAKQMLKDVVKNKDDNHEIASNWLKKM